MKCDPMPEESAEEEHWQKVGLKSMCLHLQLGQLGGFTLLLLSSHKSDGNARGSSIMDCYGTLHRSKYGKRISHLCQGYFLKHRHDWAGCLAPTKVACWKFYSISEPNSTWYLWWPISYTVGFISYPTKKLLSYSFWALTTVYKTMQNQMLLSTRLSWQAACESEKKKYSRLVCHTVLWFKGQETDFLLIPVYPDVTAKSYVLLIQFTVG